MGKPATSGIPRRVTERSNTLPAITYLKTVTATLNVTFISPGASQIDHHGP